MPNMTTPDGVSRRGRMLAPAATILFESIITNSGNGRHASPSVDGARGFPPPSRPGTFCVSQGATQVGGLLMRPRELFGVAVRVIGLWFLCQAANSALWGVWRSNGGAGSTYIPVGEHVGSALIYFILGVPVLLLADPISWLLYGLPVKATHAVAPESVDTNTKS